MSRRRSGGASGLGVIGILIVVAVAFYVVAALLAWALLVAVTGAVWAVVEANNRRRGRPYVEPKQRFLAVWTRGVSPIDRKKWVTPEHRPATDPRLLPGVVTGALRVEPGWTERASAEGTFERFVIRCRITNHGPAPVILDDLDHVDVQLWDINDNVVGTDTEWSVRRLDPGYQCEATISVRIVAEQPIASWAIAHRGVFGAYVFFPANRPERNGRYQGIQSSPLGA